MLRGKSIGGLTLCVVVVLAGGIGEARGDLAGEFDGFDSVSEIGVSGLRSSYYVDSAGGTVLPDDVFTLGSQRVWYPGVGEAPSPGGSAGRGFDQGVLGVKFDGDRLTVRSATSVNPLTGRYLGGTMYGEGDVFLSVSDGAGVREYALLNSWARWRGRPLSLNGGHFDSAKEFHTGQLSGVNLEGHLVQLTGAGDILLSGGRAAYDPSPTPVGLDYRIFAQGGIDMGDAGLVHSSITDDGMCGSQPWYVQTWEFDVDWLTNGGGFSLGLHQSPSCANDQIGMVMDVVANPVPAPTAALLGGFGLCIAAAGKSILRRIRRNA